MKGLLLMLIYFVSLTGRAQIITTVAGTGPEFFGGGVFGGDGGPASAAQLNMPASVAVDLSGNVYFSDNGNNRIRKISKTGFIYTVAGNGINGFSGDGGPATNASISTPDGVAIDNIGNIYFSDNGNYRIRKIDTLGIITTVAGDGTSYNAATMSSVAVNGGALAIDKTGEIYITDAAYNCIRKVDSYGMVTTVFGDFGIGFAGDGFPARDAEFYNPYGIAIDLIGNIYIADAGNACIRKVDTAGIISTVACTGGVRGYSGDGGKADTAKCVYPVGITVDNSGNLYFTDMDNERIRKVDSSGRITTVAGNGTDGYSGDGGLSTTAQLYWPNGIAVDSSFNLYFADDGNNRIRQITAVAQTVRTSAIVNTVLKSISNIEIYPNPSQCRLTITSTTMIENIAIIDMMDKVMCAYNCNSEKFSIDISALNAGVYFIKINETEIKKFVKQ